LADADEMKTTAEAINEITSNGGMMKAATLASLEEANDTTIATTTDMETAIATGRNPKYFIRLRAPLTFSVSVRHSAFNPSTTRP
jgi:hypothetical protein